MRSPKVAELHPLQDADTVQGMLEIIWRLERFLREISGMDRFTPARRRVGGDLRQRRDDPRVPRLARRGASATRSSPPSSRTRRTRPARGTAGYRVITIDPDAARLPRPGRAARRSSPSGPRRCSSRTPRTPGSSTRASRSSCALVHEAGGLCIYDQANANGILGITRARDAGFDLCHFNLHKTFSTPHGQRRPRRPGPVASRRSWRRSCRGPPSRRTATRYWLDARPAAEHRQDPAVPAGVRPTSSAPTRGS